MCRCDYCNQLFERKNLVSLASREFCSELCGEKYFDGSKRNPDDPGGSNEPIDDGGMAAG